LLIIKEKIESIVVESINKAIDDKRIDIPKVSEVKIEYPKDEKFGDYSTPFALESAKLLKKNPMDVASVIAEYVSKNDFFEKVDVVRPGFLNLYISKKVLNEVSSEIISLADSFGIIKKNNPERVNIEFVSANPTGPLNIVSARAAAVGDTLANLITAAGDIVDREFYINDYGNQVRLLGESVLSRYRTLNGIENEFPEEGYRGEYIKDIASFINDKFKSEADSITDHSELVDFFAKKAIEYNVSGQKEVMSRFKVNYKQWFSERTLHEDGSVENTFTDLKDHGVLYEEEGKTFFRSTDFGDDKDRVVMRDDGRPTYLLADIAHHRNKFKRGYSKVIDIWGPDHHGYIARLSGAVKALGHKESAFRVLIAQQVNLIANGELVKMSKRLGQFSTMADLIEEIGTDVARYFFVMRSMDSHLDFDLVLAKKESSENPVFYLQYAHARICSIFREADSRNFPYIKGVSDTSVFDSPETVALLKALSKYPEEIKDAANSLEPHRIGVFLLKLAQLFHRFYAENRVLVDDEARRNSLLTVCDCVRIVIRNGLSLVGVNAPEKM